VFHLSNHDPLTGAPAPGPELGQAPAGYQPPSLGLPQTFYELEQVFAATRQMDSALRREQGRSRAIHAELNETRSRAQAAATQANARVVALEAQVARLGADVKTLRTRDEQLVQQGKRLSQLITEARTAHDQLKKRLEEEQRGRSSEREQLRADLAREQEANRGAGEKAKKAQALNDAIAAELKRKLDDMTAREARARSELASGIRHREELQTQIIDGSRESQKIRAHYAQVYARWQQAQREATTLSARVAELTRMKAVLEKQYAGDREALAKERALERETAAKAREAERAELERRRAAERQAVAHEHERARELREKLGAEQLRAKGAEDSLAIAQQRIRVLEEERSRAQAERVRAEEERARARAEAEAQGGARQNLQGRLEETATESRKRVEKAELEVAELKMSLARERAESASLRKQLRSVQSELERVRGVYPLRDLVAAKEAELARRTAASGASAKSGLSAAKPKGGVESIRIGDDAESAEVAELVAQRDRLAALLRDVEN
jgi:chromosome segregation ATPase